MLVSFLSAAATFLCVLDRFLSNGALQQERQDFENDLLGHMSAVNKPGSERQILTLHLLKMEMMMVLMIGFDLFILVILVGSCKFVLLGSRRGRSASARHCNLLMRVLIGGCNAI